MFSADRPLALITGVSRSISIGASIARTLADNGWNIALSFWQPYDESMPWGSNPEEVLSLLAELESLGADVLSIEADLSQAESPMRIFDSINKKAGPVTALIMSHCHSVDSDIITTSLESFDLHFAINARASWLLVQRYSEQFAGEAGSGRIISITSDHTAGNLPYGASKGAMDRIVLAAAKEFRGKGITANIINPGATDTGWMNDGLKSTIKDITLLNRLGMPQDCANLVKFLCSKEGGWINGQLVYSNGGIE